jgi:hypothetical protein
MTAARPSINFARWLLITEERQGGWLLYHGTSSKYLPDILSQGLIPFPKNRSWDSDPDANYHTPSRASLGGIYLTSNLLTAKGAAWRTAKNTSGNELIVMVDVHPNSLLADEDDFMTTATVFENEWQVTNLYAIHTLTHDHQFVNLLKNTEHGDIYLNEMKSILTHAVDKYTDNFLTLTKWKMKTMHPGLESRVRSILQNGFNSALKRQVSYVDDYTYKKGFWNNLNGVEYQIPPKPNKEVAEKEFKEFQNEITRTMKGMVKTNKDSIMNTARIEEPIRFSGRNKIILVSEVIEKPNREKFVKIHYGTVPDKFKADWRSAIGVLNLLS